MFNDLEIRVLTCKKDVQIALTMVESLRKYNEFTNVPIYFHSDGSLDYESKNILLSSYFNKSFSLVNLLILSYRI